MKLDLLYPDFTSYDVLKVFTEELGEALKRAGHEVRLIDLNKREDVQKHISLKPQATIAFNGLLPDVNGRFLYEFTKVPHVALLLDHPERFLPLFEHPKTLIGVIDKYHLEFAKKHAPKSFFFPHAIDGYSLVNETARDIPLLLPMSLITPKSQEEEIEQQARKNAIEAVKAFPHAIAGRGSQDLGEVPWPEMKRLFERAKLVLQVTPKIKEGSHERVFEALNRGALPISTPNNFLLEEFPSIPQYRSEEELKMWVERLLNDESERSARVKEALPKLRKEHTWDQRVKVLTDELGKMLQGG